MTTPVWRSSAIGIVSFYLPDRAALDGRDPESLDCDRDWEIFGTGVYVWVLQTFLRLREAGAPVRLCGTAPRSGVVVAHADYVERLLAEAPSAADLTVVAARADRSRQIYADLEVVQNESSVDDFQVFIPSWPQPGLVPRRSERGTRIQTVAYAGARKQLHPDLIASGWIDALRARGLSWELRVVDFSGNDQGYRHHRWNDYSTTDVIVALRPPGARNLGSKPAAKLTNAWAAGVPAILGPEPPYRELRRSPLDYLEVHSGAEAVRALDRLRDDPTLYRDMIENGFQRAPDFDTARVAERWAEALWRIVPSRTTHPRHRFAARFRGYRAVARKARSMLRA